MSERRRITSFDAEITALEKQLTAKKAERAAALNQAPKAAAAPAAKPAKASTEKKAATGDNEIRQWTEQISQEDNKQLMGEIKALEDKMAEDEMGPLDAGDDMPKEASDEDKEAGDILDQNSRAEKNWPAEKPNEDMANKNDAIMSEDKDMDNDEPKAADDNMDDKKEASAKKADEGQPQGEIEEEIENDHNQMVEEFDPNMEGDNIIPVAEKKKMAKSVSAKELQAAKYKEATKRLDRVAAYLEKHGRKQLAYRIDKVSDAIEAKLKAL